MQEKGCVDKVQLTAADQSFMVKFDPEEIVFWAAEPSKIVDALTHVLGWFVSTEMVLTDGACFKLLDYEMLGGVDRFSVKNAGYTQCFTREDMEGIATQMAYCSIRGDPSPLTEGHLQSVLGGLLGHRGPTELLLDGELRVTTPLQGAPDGPFVLGMTKIVGETRTALVTELRALNVGNNYVEGDVVDVLRIEEEGCVVFEAGDEEVASQKSAIIRIPNWDITLRVNAWVTVCV